jgi:S-disulfanyl-L-cysteine oxidoreductase SoxD
MSRLEWILPVVLSFAGVVAAAAESPPQPSFGAPVTEAELGRYRAIPPSGAGLPPGRGDAAQGKAVYAAKCASCHGEHLEGVKEAGGAAFLGGTGTLTSAKPVKTLQSYWPYATTVFDYVKRAMPFNAPGSLSDDEVYAVTAYLLSSARILPDDAALDAASLPKVGMPNRDGFYPDPRPKR